jgi:hypothetical protein
MSKLDRNRLAAFLTTAGLAAVAIALAAGVQIGQFKGKVGNLKVQGQIAVAPGPRNIGIDLHSFECLDADESLPVSNGDEPYLFVRVFWMDGTTINLDSLGTADFRYTNRAPIQGNLGVEHTKAGDAFGIPVPLTHLNETVQPIAPTAGFPSGAPVQIGMAVIACEQDQSGAHTAAGPLQRDMDKFHDEIRGAIRTMTPVGAFQLRNKILSFFTNRYEALILANPLAVIDPDDVVGSKFVLWTLPEIEQAGPKGLPFTLDFKNLTAHYRIRGVARVRTLPPPPRRDVIVTIRRVKEVDDLESFVRGDPDFQARVVIDGRVFMSPEKSGNPINPNWTFKTTAVSHEIPISIQLFERDGLTSPDESCDINPRNGAKCLLLKFDRQTGQVTGDAIGPGARGLVSSGLGDSDRAEIEFTVTTAVK